jgi:hypothetical protein
MSIAEFTAALRDKSNITVQADAKNMLDRLVSGAVDAFKAGSLSKKASILSEGKATIAGKTVNLSQEFRYAGEPQGRTRLILTEDDLEGIFSTLKIKSDAKPIALYIQFLAKNFANKMASHYEIYFTDGTVLEKQRKKISDVVNEFKPEQIANIIAIRGLNFSHRNTLTHVAHFIHSINAMPGKSRKDIEDTLSGHYDRGHVYAQTYGRAIISAQNLTAQDDLLNKIIRLYKLLDEGSSSLSQMNGKYNELLARAHKDFTGNKIAMNIQLQIKRDIETGLGNRDTGDLSSYIRIVGFLQSLVQNTKLSSDGKRLLSQPAAVSLKEFEKALVDLDKKLVAHNENLVKVLSKTTNPSYLVELRTSDNIPEYLSKLYKDILESKGSGRQTKKTTPNIQALKSQKLKTKVSSPLNKVKLPLANMKTKLAKIKSELRTSKTAKVQPASVASLNLVSLQNLINQQLQSVISANMGDGNSRNVLNYRTGRLASSAKVEYMSESRAGMITAFYSYMKNPYATFSDGGRQQNPRSRDPKLLIAKSIREIAQQQVGNRLRAVNI